MTLLMTWLRHLFIIIPAAATLLARPIDLSTSLFVICVLLAVLAVKLGELFPRLAAFLAACELIGLGAMSYKWDGYLFLMPYSTLIAIYSLSFKPRSLSVWAISGLAVQFSAMNGREPELMFTACLLWMLLSAVLTAAKQYDEKRNRTEQLYDQLAMQNEELDAARRRVVEYAAQIELYAQTEERNRIARDIHDDLGHRLIRVKMMAEAALHLFDHDVGRARGTVEQMRDQLQDSMDRMRHTVRKLSASDEESRVYSLDKLVREASDMLGIELSFTITGRPEPLYPSIEYVLYRNAQEAITNAVRHGGASHVSVDLDFRPDGIVLSVDNDGSLPEEPVTNGLGLRGMQERAALVGGTMTYQTERRFSVRTWIPTHPQTRAKIQGG
ncbi:sensor histidine kinase [Paenibacillus sp. PR3]|uniref:histidine kinase n=1 Tax=Paenibacillus terricola TaxID=2763503 RepID=A0ABR8MR47_9BACL|nr:sensor histidine kinase [Paenibacillus terricola]MBD3918085.1 sensor histidine kinase [Paenibacillus terricola]